jgi:hypothetical protein
MSDVQATPAVLGTPVSAEPQTTDAAPASTEPTQSLANDVPETPVNAEPGLVPESTAGEVPPAPALGAHGVLVLNGQTDERGNPGAELVANGDHPVHTFLAAIEHLVALVRSHL